MPNGVCGLDQAVDLGFVGPAWLISATPEDGATVVYDVTPEGTTRIALPWGWITVTGSTGR